MAIAPFYWLTFAAFALPAAWLELGHGGSLRSLSSSSGGPGGGGGGTGYAGPLRAGARTTYAAFRANYLAVFSLMMAGDWLQGPYIYHLYEHYGYGVRDIGRLFIMGFASSAVFGTIVGALADKHGRKRASLLYVATYAASCATKHSPRYGVLLVGRLLGGVATSLLFSVFEAWAVAAHAARGFDEPLLADLFTKAVMLGNGVMAIASGLIGSWLVQGLGLGPVAPFDAAIIALLAGGAVVAATWEENRGDAAAGGGGGIVGQFRAALLTIARDERVALLGVMQALFEASMYTFVFLWTPALNPHTYVPVVTATGSSGSSSASSSVNGGGGPSLALPKAGRELLSAAAAGAGAAGLPHGLVFAIFMTASMVGTALAGRLMAAWRLEAVLKGVFWAGAALLAVPAAYHTGPLDRAAAADALAGETHAFERGGGAAAAAAAEAAAAEAAAAAGTAELDAGGRVQLLAFCGFEVLIGLFWPAMMALRARYVPEEQRATVINIFRVPLNAFVCLILWKVSDLPLGAIFGVCCGFLAAAALAQERLAYITQQQPPPQHQQHPQLQRANSGGDKLLSSAAAAAAPDAPAKRNAWMGLVERCSDPSGSGGGGAGGGGSAGGGSGNSFAAGSNNNSGMMGGGLKGGGGGGGGTVLRIGRTGTAAAAAAASSSSAGPWHAQSGDDTKVATP